MCFGVYGHPRNKTVRALLRPKADNILPSLSWVITTEYKFFHIRYKNKGGTDAFSFSLLKWVQLYLYLCVFPISLFVLLCRNFTCILCLWFDQKWSDFQLLNVTLELGEATLYAKSLKNKHLKKHDKKDVRFFVTFEIDYVPGKRPFLLSRDFGYAQCSGGISRKFQVSLLISQTFNL